jgi:hypothetical protein
MKHHRRYEIDERPRHRTIRLPRILRTGGRADQRKQGRIQQRRSLRGALSPRGHLSNQHERLKAMLEVWVPSDEPVTSSGVV